MRLPVTLFDARPHAFKDIALEFEVYDPGVCDLIRILEELATCFALSIVFPYPLFLHYSTRA